MVKKNLMEIERKKPGITRSSRALLFVSQKGKRIVITGGKGAFRAGKFAIKISTSPRVKKAIKKFATQIFPKTKKR